MHFLNVVAQGDRRTCARQLAGHRARRLTNCGRALILIGWCVLLAPSIAPNALAQFRVQVQGGMGRRVLVNEPSLSGVYLPTDRSLSRAVARARERLANREFHEALAFLHGILAREEDSFLETSGNERQQQGLKAAARRLIGELPSEGLDAYELLYGAAARRQLDVALRSGDQAGVARVVRQFFHTVAGYEATLVLAQMEADQGHRLAAAQWYQELIDSPRAAARFEPQLSVLAALNHLAGGNTEAATATLRRLLESRPATEVVLSGQTVTAPALGGDLAGWLSQLVGEPVSSLPRSLQWLTLRGDPGRNSRVPGGRPHLRPRWQARVVNDPDVERYLTDRIHEFAGRGEVLIPAARPIAVGDVVVMRTPENLVAVNWQTGKRVWETRGDEEFESDDTRRALLGGLDPEQAAAAGRPIEDRVWRDELTMSLASDGRRVFMLRGRPIPQDEDQVMAWQMMPGMGGFGGEQPTTTNQLVAYDVATQGKLVWELDGARAAAPLDGAFFLGPPLAIDETLFAMAEIRSAVYLVALDPATGSARWQQQLVGLEMGIARDPLRSRTGATPSYAAGILLCPTGAGAVVAIDVVKREFAWVYRYSREAESTTEARQIWQQTPQGQPNGRWLDGAAIVADGRVLLAPPESGELHCIDLQTGKQLWKQRRGDALFIGCVEDGRVLLVGAESVKALRLADGTTAWGEESAALPLGGTPSGQGYLSEGWYYLPLTSGEVAAIKMATGEMLGLPSAAEGTALGNLIAYRGSILSQSALLVEKFEQLNVLEERARKALAAAPDDAAALVELAELKRAEGKAPEAVKLLKRAFELSPDEPLAREMLAEALLEAIAADYATFRGDVPLVRRLIRDRPQQIELLRIEAVGLEKLGQRLAAWDAYLRLADFTAEEPVYLRIGDDYQARSDRWICGRVRALWAAASAAERDSMTARIAGRRPKLDNPRTAAELRHYLAHLGQLPGADDVRRALARLLIERERYSEAELELLQLMATAGSENEALVAELSKKLPSNLPQNGGALAGARVWRRGHVRAELLPVAAATPERAPRGQQERQGGVRQLRIEQDVVLRPSDLQWLVALDSSELVARNTVGDEVYRLAIDQNNWPHQYRDSSLAHAARLGNLLFVNIGGLLIALDGRQQHVSGVTHAAVESFPGLLWQSGSLGKLSGSYRGRNGSPVSRASRRPAYHTWSSRKRLTGAVGMAVGSLGPATPRGVVFQDHNQLECVDPLSGELLWARSDIPAGCELFGDEEYLFAADAGARVAHVIRMIDGELVGRRDLPEYEWLVTAGRNVAEIGFRAAGDKRALLVRVTDMWSQDVLFEADYALASRTSVLEPHSVAIYEPTGKFQLIDVRSGRTVIDQQLAAVPDLQGIYTLLSGDELFLFVTSPPQQKQYAPIGQPEYPLINGLVYALSLKSGEPLWPAPATVRHRGIVLSQPAEIPLLVFADQKMTRDAGAGGGSQLRVLCLDKRTGQAVYRNDGLPATPATRFRVRAERDGPPGVALDTSAGKIQLTMTNRPRPPQPPANDDLEAPREIAERGLRGIGERMGSVLRGALERGAPPAPLQQEQLNPAPVPPEEIDDD